MKLSQYAKYKSQTLKLRLIKRALNQRLRYLKKLPRLSTANMDEVATIKMMIAKANRQLLNLSWDRHKPISWKRYKAK
jgi:hypothetical protein